VPDGCAHTDSMKLLGDAVTGYCCAMTFLADSYKLLRNIDGAVPTTRLKARVKWLE